MGPVPERAPVGHGARGLQRERRRVVLLQPRSVSVTRVPLGRGWARWHQRREAAPVPRARAVERARPDPEGAPLRAHQRRGQPRRGREGVLLLRRQPADAQLPAVAVQVPARRVPVRRPRRRRTGRARGTRWSTSCSTPASSTTSRYFDVEVEHVKVEPEDLLCRITVHNRSAETATLHVLPTLWFRNTWSWAPTTRKPTLRRVEAAHPAVQAEHDQLGVFYLLRRAGRRAAVLRERDEQPRASGSTDAVDSVPEGRHQRPRRPRRTPPSIPGRGHEGFASTRIVTVAGGDQATVLVRLTRRSPESLPEPFVDADGYFAMRRAEADEFYDVDHAAGRRR